MAVIWPRVNRFIYNLYLSNVKEEFMLIINVLILSSAWRLEKQSRKKEGRGAVIVQVVIISKITSVLHGCNWYNVTRQGKMVELGSQEVVGAYQGDRAQKREA